MRCRDCDCEMIAAKLCGGIGSDVWLEAEKKGIFDAEKRCAVSCCVCLVCGRVELRADEPMNLFA